MEKNKTKKRMDISPCIKFVIGISVLILAGALLGVSFFGVEKVKAVKIIFWNIEYFFVFALSLEMYDCSHYLENRRLPAALLCFAVSFLGVMVSGRLVVLNFWMLGILILGLCLHPYIGAVFQIILTFSYCIVNGFGMEYYICYFTLGTLLILLTRFMDRFLNLFFILLIIITTNGAFLLLLNNFVMDYSSRVGMELISTVFMVLLVFGIQVNKKEEKEKEPLELKKSEEKEKPKKKGRTVSKCVFQEDEKVSEKIKKFSYPLYKHGCYIGELSYGAAKAISADADLAKVGGIYHECGRIHGGRYVEEGVKLLRKHKIPKQVIQVVEEHNINYKKPTSKEAAVVMLSDSIVSTIQYLENKQGKAPVETVIQSVFAKRMEKGMFSESGLTKEDINTLQRYYLEAMKKND